MASIVKSNLCIYDVTLFEICIYIPSGPSLHVYESVICALNSFYIACKISVNDKVVFLGDFNVAVHSWLAHDTVLDSI